MKQKMADGCIHGSKNGRIRNTGPSTLKSQRESGSSVVIKECGAFNRCKKRTRFWQLQAQKVLAVWKAVSDFAKCIGYAELA